MASSMLYAKCSVCDGTQKSDICSGGVCICARSETPGWSPVGITEGQVDRLVQLDRALAGDPGIPPAKARQLLRETKLKLVAALQRLGPP